MTSPTLTQLATLTWIAEFLRINGYAPTNREVCAAFGVKSTNATADMLEALERKGLIRRSPRKARALCLTELGHRFTTPTASGHGVNS